MLVVSQMLLGGNILNNFTWMATRSCMLSHTYTLYFHRIQSAHAPAILHTIPMGQYKATDQLKPQRCVKSQNLTNISSRA